MRPNRTAICEHCGIEFQVKQSTKANRFCSSTCYHAGRVRPLADRFLEKLSTAGPNECWEWQGNARNSFGYGSISSGPPDHTTLIAHRVAYEHFVGAIPDGMIVCHECDNPTCCNPAHLFLGTTLDNVRDKIEKGRVTEPSNQMLSDTQVAQVRQRYAIGGVTQYELADEYGVSQSLIHLIVSGKHRV